MNEAESQRIYSQVEELEEVLQSYRDTPYNLWPEKIVALGAKVKTLLDQLAPKPKQKYPTKARWKKALAASLGGTATDDDREVLATIKDAPWARKDARLADLYKLYHPTAGAEAVKQDLLFMAQILVLCGLPYRQPKDSEGKPLTHWERAAQTAQGEVRLILGTLDPAVGLPFGKDRVLLSWLITKALQKGSPEITWETATEFFDAFGLDSGGSTYKWFLAAWTRLKNLAIKIDRKGDADEGKLRVVIEDYRLPSMREQQNETGGGGAIRLPYGAPYSVELGSKLFAELQEGRVVPLPLPVMREFQDEPKAWDFACFVFWRSWVCEKAIEFNGNPTARIPWRDMLQQLGSTDKDPKQIRKTLKAFLERLKIVWPECQANFEEGGVLTIRPPASSLHLVKPKD